ncbi:hypothetical protein, conserved [Eimeria necatrix]|uniref:Transmembrane protein n=1 Tax=Eimeria necatrix TaxID=51315 RepID=U6MXY9_9EIME|nr:hypothetical protein, conserved [Eimeria necatrix]CDJ69097.1 hypothetical protein, conserved [Eimeria necatrix]
MVCKTCHQQWNQCRHSIVADLLSQQQSRSFCFSELLLPSLNRQVYFKKIILICSSISMLWGLLLPRMYRPLLRFFIASLPVWLATHGANEGECASIVVTTELPSEFETLTNTGFSVPVQRGRRTALRLWTLFVVAAALAVTFLVMKCFNGLRAGKKAEYGTRRLAEAPDDSCFVSAAEKRSLKMSCSLWAPHGCPSTLKYDVSQVWC